MTEHQHYVFRVRPFLENAAKKPREYERPTAQQLQDGVTRRKLEDKLTEMKIERAFSL
ncbi:hypothetical protein [Vibrio albus]|uniref:hypothetical protein n=1 Tax=Vibrio albus TaxID=2200953 RepID=UPI0015E8672E|nr:hypothetical protein [Vibrio albus]